MTKLQKLIKELHNELIKEYSPHHHNHLGVFSAFWNLVNIIDIDKILNLSIYKEEEND